MAYRSADNEFVVRSDACLLEDEYVDQDSEEEAEDYNRPQNTNFRAPTKNRKRNIIGVTIALVFIVAVAIAVLVLVVFALTTSPHSAPLPVTQEQQHLDLTAEPSTALTTSVDISTVTPRCGDASGGVVCLGSGVCSRMLIGSKENGIFVFKGVPYAQPPTSDLRWKPPQPLNNSCPSANGPIYSRSYGNKCLQWGKDDVRSEGSEDCLYLNVWTPTLAADADLHVMVYFHGGGLISGSGHDSISAPHSDLVTEANMVFVTFNYRLNAFGFMAVEALATSGTAGNYGLMDQIMALQWVHQNIRNFGGSPKKVTVFGQGSGATSIYALLASNSSVGLFQTAWLASPSPKLETSLSEAYDQNAEFLNKTECWKLRLDNQLSCLLNLSAETILQAVPWTKWKNLQLYRLPQKTEKSIAITIVDGLILKCSPLEAWKRMKFNQVRLLIGNTAQETDSYPMNVRLTHGTWYKDYVRQLMLPFDHVNFSQVIGMYSDARSPEYVLTTMVSDIRVVCPVDEVIKVVANASVPLPMFRYMVSYSANRGSGACKNYAYSGIDVEAFFNVEGSPSLRVTGSLERDTLTQAVRRIVFDFVRTGSVSGWDSFPMSSYNISTTVERISPRFMSDECNFWRRNGFFPEYSWMN